MTDHANTAVILGLAVYTAVALACLGIWWLQVGRTNGRHPTEEKTERATGD